MCVSSVTGVFTELYTNYKTEVVNVDTADTQAYHHTGFQSW